MLASASADGTVKLWNVEERAREVALAEADPSSSWPSDPFPTLSPPPAAAESASVATLRGHSGDVYSVNFRPGDGAVLSSGYAEIGPR